MSVDVDITDFMRRWGVRNALLAAAMAIEAGNIDTCLDQIREAILWLPENPAAAAFLGRLAGVLGGELAEGHFSLPFKTEEERGMCAQAAHFLRMMAGPRPSATYDTALGRVEIK